MIKVFRLERDFAEAPSRFTLYDIVSFFGEELKQEGFDLEMEMVYETEFIMDTYDTVVTVTQDDRFRVRPANSFYPYAII